MGAEVWAALSALGVSVTTAAGAVYTARAARRTAHQERRDDFEVITRRMERGMEQLEARIQRQEAEAEKQRERIADQDEAIGWLVQRLRGLVSYVQRSGLQPPPADPMPERAARYIRGNDI